MSIVVLLVLTLAPDGPLALGLGTPGPPALRIERPGYTLGYDRARGRAAWAAWHLDADDLGDPPVARDATFAPDPALPASWYRATDAAYAGSGFDRGHLCPSGDRSATRAANDATFLFCNVVPQSPALNRGPWLDLEAECRIWARSGFEMYIVAGPAGVGGSGAHGKRWWLDGGRLAVPAACWKVVIVLPEGDDDLNRVGPAATVIAVLMPDATDLPDREWEHYRVPVDAIEDLTGLDFLADVAPEIQAALED